MSVTQPAVSRLIADLEYYLKFKLFERAHGRLIPTPEALKFYEGVERFFIGIDELDRAAQQIHQESTSELRIAVTPALSTSLLPKAIATFRQAHENVAFHLETVSFSQIALRLQTHQTQIGIAHAFPQLPGITQETLIRAGHVCAMHESHPLAAQDVIRVEDLKGEDVLRILPDGNVNWDDADTVFRQARVRTRSSIGIQSSHTGYAMIAAKLAIGLIEPFAAGPWLSNGVVTRPFSPSVAFDYVVALPQSQRRSDLIQGFIDTLRDTATQFADPTDTL